MRGLRKATLAMLVIAGCGRDGAITEPDSPNAPTSGGEVLAIGVDTVTGATIETDRDHYLPGEVVHLAGRGWAAGETVNLHMTEQPNTHADVDTNVVADASGEFNVHFYDVQQHDLGVTFTLTATGQTSGSRAVATFYDGDVQVEIAPAFYPSASGTSRRFSVLVRHVSGLSRCVKITVPYPMTFVSASASQPGWTGSGSGNVVTVTGSLQLAGGNDWVRVDVDAIPPATSNADWNVSSWTNTGCTTNQGNIDDPAVNIGDPQLWTYTADFRNPADPPLTAGIVAATGIAGTPSNYRLRLTNTSGSTGDNGIFAVIALPPCFSAPTSISVSSNGTDATWTFTTRDNFIRLESGLLEKAKNQHVQVQFTTTPQNGCSPTFYSAMWKQSEHTSGEKDTFTITAHPSISLVAANVASTVEAGGPYSGAEGSAIALSGASASDPDAGDVLTYKWTANTTGIDAGGNCTFSPNNTVLNPSVTCTDDSQGATGGKFILTLEVRDGAGNHTVTDNGDLTVANAKPTANANGPYGGNVNSPIALTGTGADVGTNDVSSYSWSVNNAGIGACTFAPNNTAQNPTISCTLPSAGAPGGVFTLSLTVSDDDGLTSDVSQADLTVTNQAPTSNTGAPAGGYSGNEGSAITLTGSGSDPDGGTVSYLWSVSPNDGKCSFGDATLASTTVTCSDNGSWTLSLKVTDDESAFTTSTGTLNVANVAPTIGSKTLGTTVNEGSSIPFSVGNVTDPSSDDQAASFTYAFSCDGAPYGAFGPSNTTNCPAGDGPGSVTIAGKAMDKDGGVGDPVSSTFNVLNVKPTITAVSTNLPVNEGSNAMLTVTTVTDPWPGDLAGATYAFACDGTTYGSSTSSNSVSCPTTDGPAVLTVGAKVKDKDGAESDPFTQDVTVQNVPPAATFAAQSPVNEGASFNLSLTNPSDPSSADVAAGFTYAFDCGSGYGAFGTTTSASCSTADNGTRSVGGKIRDKDGGESTYTGSVTVNNVAPSATFTAQSPVNEGSSFNLSLTNPADPSNVDVAAGFTYAFDCGSGYGAFTASSSTACPTTDNGARSVGGKIRDKDGGESTYTGSVIVNNVAPTATFTAQSPVNEGSSFNLSLTNPVDPSSADEAAGFTYAFDCGDGSGYGAFGAATSASCPTTDNGTRSVGGKIRDKDGGESPYTGSVTVNNVPPDIGTITGAPIAPIQAGTNVTINWDFTDPGSDTWPCSIQWDTGENFAAATYVAPKSCSATKALGPGLYTVTVKVSDDDGGEDTETLVTYIVVYDPNGGFVTGGGWIMSPLGAYTTDPSLTGKANFGFVSKYQQGKTLPQGNTEFQFHAGNLNFRSTVYEWLVVAGTRAQFRGDGTINGVGGYGFLLTAIDGSPDRFRIKIVNKETSAVVYDNQSGALDDSPAATDLGGGSIVIHTKK